MEDDTRLLDAADLCERLGIGRTLAYSILAEVPTVRLGRLVKVTEADLRAYLESQRAEPVRPAGAR